MIGASSPSAGYLASTSSDVENALPPKHTDSLTQASHAPVILQCFVLAFKKDAELCEGVLKLLGGCRIKWHILLSVG